MKKKQPGERAGAGDDSSLVSVLGSESSKKAPLSVSQLATKIEHAIKAGVSEQVHVVGEISSLSNRTHYYFVLKDAKCVINAVVFASAARRMSYTPKHGDSVIAKGRVEYYAPGGRVTLIVTSLSPIGEGGLEAQFRKRASELKERGWFEPENKLAVPSFPRRIAVITSKDGAAIADVIDTAKKRCPSVEITVIDVRVQGTQAKGQIVRAIEMVNTRVGELGVDAILLSRGGGSLEDLWAFNEMEVAQAIHDSQIPIVAAIGHETDTTIAELVADLRCATPTQAAMSLAPDREAMHEQLITLQKRITRAIQGRLRYELQRLAAIQASRSLADPTGLIQIHRDRLDGVRQRLSGLIVNQIVSRRSSLDRLTLRLAKHQPSAVHARREERLNQIEQRLARTISRQITHRKEHLHAIERELQAIGPIQVLKRGFSITAGADGTLLRSAKEACQAEHIITTFTDGKIQSKVVSGDARPAPKEKAPKRSKPDSDQSDQSESDQFGLFS